MPARSLVLRVLANAALLAFASLAVISLVAGRLAPALLWCGALLVLLAPALDRRRGLGDRPVPNGNDPADHLRWAGLALALTGAALLAV